MGLGAYQRLEMAWMVCWRVDVHSASQGSFSIKTCGSQVTAQLLVLESVPLLTPSLISAQRPRLSAWYLREPQDYAPAPHPPGVGVGSMAWPPLRERERRH